MAFGKEVGPLGEDTCTALSTCKAGVFGSEPGEFEGPASIALDNAPGGEGDVYVADTGTGLIQKFTAQGKLERSWAIEGQLTEAPAPSVTADLTAGSDVITATSGQFLGEFFTAHKERAESPKEQQEEEERGEANWVGGEELVGEGIPAGTHIKNCPSNTRCELYTPRSKRSSPRPKREPASRSPHPRGVCPRSRSEAWLLTLRPVSSRSTAPSLVSTCSSSNATAVIPGNGMLNIAPTRRDPSPSTVGVRVSELRRGGPRVHLRRGSAVGWGAGAR